MIFYNKNEISDHLILPKNALLFVLLTAVSNVADSVDNIADSCRQYSEGSFHAPEKSFLKNIVTMSQDYKIY